MWYEGLITSHEYRERYKSYRACFMLFNIFLGKERVKRVGFPPIMCHSIMPKRRLYIRLKMMVFYAVIYNVSYTGI